MQLTTILFDLDGTLVSMDNDEFTEIYIKLLAAKAMGADFCAVLTGVAGESGRAYFEEQNAEFILRNVGEMNE